MKINQKSEKVSGAVRFVTYFIVALALALAQMTFLDFISVGGISPDLLLALCVWITLAEGPFAGLISAFAIGILFDVVSLDVVGTNALAKVIASFIAGRFYSESKSELILKSYRFILIFILAAFFHNIVYFFFYVKATDLNFSAFFLKYGLGSTFYTSIFAAGAMLLNLRKS